MRECSSYTLGRGNFLQGLLSFYIIITLFWPFKASLHMDNNFFFIMSSFQALKSTNQLFIL